MNTLLRKKH